MATKNINGGYPAGYYLKPAYQTLDIGPAGSVGGAGVTTTATQPSTIDNLGKVQGTLGTANGITLPDGGSVTNGSATNTTALVEGYKAVAVYNAAGTVINYGSLRSNAVLGTGNGVNPQDVGVYLEHGGTVINGSSTDTSALISGYTSGSGYSYGVTTRWGFLFGVQSTISNFGTIEDHQRINAVHSNHYYRTVGVLLIQGTLTNGGATDTTALISADDVGLTLDLATATNFGTIQASYSILAGAPSAGVSLGDRATITNGSAADTTALISGTIGIDGNTGTIVNFGTIKGAGGVAISVGDSTLIEEATGVFDGAVSGGGASILRLAGDAGKGTLAGLGSTITGFATVDIMAGASWTLTGPVAVAAKTVLSNHGSLTVTGTVTNSGTIDLFGQMVSSGSIVDQTGSQLLFEGDYSITTDPAVKAGQFSNAGLVEKASGTGTSIIRTGNASLTSNGTIDVATGTLELTGSTVNITGKITGAGTIEFSTGATTLNTGTTITAAGLMLAGSGAGLTVAHNLGYSGTFSAGANTELTIASGALLQVSGSASFLHDTVDGAGRLTTSGTSAVNLVTLGGTAQWFNTGTITETGTLTIGDSAGDKAVFNNQAAGVFDLASNAGIAIGTSTASTFSNQGLVEKTVGGLSTIGIAMTNTGTIEAASGTLDLQQAVTGTGGTLKIDAGKVIQADAAVSGGQTVDFNGGGDRLILTDATHFAGKLQDFGMGDKLDLRQFAPAATTLGFVENAGNTGGTLTVTDGALVAKIALLGQYTASAFHTATDGNGGTYITYTPPPEPALIAAAH